jgi:hypothetical protein
VQVTLYSEAFTQAKVLGRKIVTLYSLSKQLLSHQVGAESCIC